MCLATVYLERDGERELVMDEVINLRIEGNTVWISQSLEGPVAVHAVLTGADFLKHTVILSALEDREGVDREGRQRHSKTALPAAPLDPAQRRPRC